MTGNYTPIDDLIQKYKSQSIAVPREAEPPLTRMDTNVEEVGMQEVVEHEVVDEEVKTHIEEKKENIEISTDLQQVGVEPVTQTQFPSYEDIKLPLTDDKVVTGLHAPIYSSMRWLATFAMYLLWQAHLSLKVVQGKVVRVLKK